MRLRTLRWLVSFGLVVLLLPACSSDSDIIEVVSDSATTVVETTSTAPTTTTAPTSTTTAAAIAPWTTLPEYPLPDIAQSLRLESATIERLCVQIDAEGVRIDAESTGIDRALQILGVEMVTVDCGAELQIAAVGSRYSAEYSGLGECWTGEILSIESALTVDGEVWQTWVVDEDRPRPDKINESQCSDSDTPVYPRRLALDGVIVAPFVEIWGVPGRFAIGAATLLGVDGIEFTDEVMSLISFRLVNEPTTGNLAYKPMWGVLGDWTYELARHTDRFDDLDRLQQLIPILVMLLDRPEGQYTWDGFSWSSGRSARGDIADILENITGEDFESPAEWWGWWQDQ